LLRKQVEIDLIAPSGYSRSISAERHEKKKSWVVEDGYFGDILFVTGGRTESFDDVGGRAVNGGKSSGASDCSSVAMFAPVCRIAG
jgi:hypothetical protein